jgi:hypothetical protein
MGSETGQFDPIPPDQYRWQFADTEPLKHRIWSWLMSHTVARGHRKAYAVDRDSHVLSLAHLAADLGLTVDEILPTWRAGVRGGIWRTDSNGLLCLLATVPKSETPPHSEEYQTPESDTKTPCTVLPDFIYKKTKDWVNEDKQALTDEWVQHSEFEKGFIAAVMVAYREVVREREDGLLAKYGFAPRRQCHRKNGETPEGAAERRGRIEALLPAMREIARTLEENFVRSSEKERTESKTDSVHSSQPLVYLEYLEGLEKDSSSSSIGESVRGDSADAAAAADPNPPPPEEKPKPQPAAEGTPPSGSNDHCGGNGDGASAVGSSFEDEVATVRLSLARFGSAEAAGARKLLRNCRRKAPGCTTTEIAAFIDRKAERFAAGRIDNPIGFLIKSVPDCFEGDYRALLAESPPGPLSMSPELRRDMQRIQETVEIARAMRKRRGLV